MNRKKSKKISFEPINLYKNNKPIKDGLRLLCCKDPSYVPLLPHHDWFQLQNLQNLQDKVDRFVNSLMSGIKGLKWER